MIALGALLVILVFGLSLRYQAFARSVVPEYPRADAAEYFLSAYNLKNFGVYGVGSLKVLPANTDPAIVRKEVPPDSLRTPGYPLYLSLFLGGEYSSRQRDNARLGQVGLSALTILLAYLAFSPFGRVYGLGVAALTALSPHLINMNLFLLSETLFCFFLVLLVLLISRLRASSHALAFFAVGITLALATITRPWILGYVFFIAAYMLLARSTFRLRQVVLVVLGASIVLSPWLIRNATLPGEAAEHSQLTKSIHHGMYPDMMYQGDQNSLAYPYKADPMSPELDESLTLTLTEITRRALEDPLEYANWYLFGKVKTVLSWDIMQGAHPLLVYPVANSPYFEIPRFYWSAYYMELIHGSLMVMALIGMLLVWVPARLQRLGPDQAFCLRAISLIVIYFLLMHMVVAPFPRYAIPMKPLLFAMALYPVVLLVRLSGFARGREAGNPPQRESTSG